MHNSPNLQQRSGLKIQNQFGVDPQTGILKLQSYYHRRQLFRPNRDTNQETHPREKTKHNKVQTD